MTQEPSFLARRRAGLKAEREAALADHAETAVAVPDDTPEEPDFSAMSDTDILEMLDLPDPDTLRKGDNFAAFMAKAVPLHLRNRALRNLWRSDPVLACLDGLNDYDADYLTGSTGQGVIQTSYQVGKGLLAHVEKMAADAAAKAAETQTDAPRDTDDAAPAPAERDAPVVLAVAPKTDDIDRTDASDDPPDDAGLPASPSRRMRFDFGESA